MTDITNSELKKKLLERVCWAKHIAGKKLADLIQLAAERIPEDGWVSVPEEPTREMLDAAYRNCHCVGHFGSYKAMIAARPEIK